MCLHLRTIPYFGAVDTIIITIIIAPHLRLPPVITEEDIARVLRSPDLRSRGLHNQDLRSPVPRRRAAPPADSAVVGSAVDSAVPAAVACGAAAAAARGAAVSAVAVAAAVVAVDSAAADAELIFKKQQGNSLAAFLHNY